MLKNLTISKKLYSGFAFMLLIIILISTIGIIKVNFIDKTLNEVVEINSVKQRYAINFRGSVHDRAIAIRDLVLSKDNQDLLFKNSLNDIRRLESFYIKSAKPLNKIFEEGLNVDEEEKIILSKIKQIEKKTLPLINKIINLKQNGEDIQAKELLINEAKDNITYWLKVINEFIDYQEQKNQIATPKAREVASEFAYTMITFLSIALILGVLIAYFISNQLIKSVQKVQNGLENFFSFINKQTFSANIIDLDSKDELGQMAKIINQNIITTEKNIKQDEAFVKDIARFAKQIGEGNLCAKIQVNSTTDSLQELKQILTKMQSELELNIAKDIPLLLKVLESYKNHDFTVRFPNAKEKVSLAINELGEVISNLLKQSLEVGKTLDESSSLLINNVNELNISSSEAAASLEQTSASLEQITQSVKSNSSNVEEMSKLSIEVDSSAKQGQAYAKNTSLSMTEIEEQVSAINEAITVIDQIAFQTNILSLNAAVEAATAGESGKGFAVVAQEVRNLANRSAQAAKEIKDIVEAATNKATLGKQTSDKMIEGYEKLLESIEKTTTTIKEIAVSSQEQENSISQINDAINLLDKQTQKNASIAAQTKEIALKNDSISKEIVLNLEDKKFN
ncbi:methyl-accepting chemotaxis protein [Malaciobacter halophilus]|uniref:Methyl-accepting chemotaxis protein n=1 Tax=Malaciobacter halophilus TaxID=197482 RepID=A0A2N1J1Y7_9BACT|nr:methyl-accepting chemotaxis protein [Malaciobacter halophilus]AXH10094.1 4HB sensor-containing MCP-domain signal transduction protein [Malaciobacter halophilus]PKI80579.1 methyl-accepting chemotaxis protein [Malaciobacter halophilus]